MLGAVQRQIKGAEPKNGCHEHRPARPLLGSMTPKLVRDLDAGSFLVLRNRRCGRLSDCWFNLVNWLLRRGGDLAFGGHLVYKLFYN